MGDDLRRIEQHEVNGGNVFGVKARMSAANSGLAG